ncbi:MAG: hypothetical protein JOY66_20660 [Acetobacteraceae bacterium]|nr:hypothetical protein [Acetobacteraceae bacterium]
MQGAPAGSCWAATTLTGGSAHSADPVMATTASSNEKAAILGGNAAKLFGFQA